MNVTRLSLAAIVGVGLAAGAFEHMLGIGSGPGVAPPAAFANEGGGGDRRDPTGQPGAQPVR